MDALVVGAGFAGATCARRLAEAGMQVRLVEKRPMPGGNAADGYDEAGVLVHWFGPHIFHTNLREVFDFLRPFAQWSPYQHRVLGSIMGQTVPIPFNFTGVDMLFPPARAAEIKKAAARQYAGREKVSVLELTDSPDPALAQLGQFVFENVFVHYTAKQWGLPIHQVDASVINRVPVVLGEDDRYFRDAVQQMPVGGYTALLEKMLDHPSLETAYGADAAALLQLDENGGIRVEGTPYRGLVIYTGPVDELLGYRFGPLPYRALDFRFETLARDRYQEAAVVNYPNEEAFTRITEFKHMTGQTLPGRTTILREYPLAYDPKGPYVPCYSIENPENRALYETYAAAAKAWPNLHLCGRLAEYRYYNMDAAIERALRLSARLLAEKAR